MNKFTVGASDNKQKKQQAHDKLSQKHLESNQNRRQQFIQEREARWKRNNLKREKREFRNKGNYDILYPFVTYAEEDYCISKLQQYHQQHKN